MQVFVIHRTSSRADASRHLKALAKLHGIDLEPFFLQNSYGPDWKAQAESAMESCEAVVVFDSEACAKSDNTTWEIERAKSLGKEPVFLVPRQLDGPEIGRLRSIYDFADEFDSCFPKKPIRGELFEVYRLMLETSEQLVQRRQVTSGFFLTIIGAMLAATGYLYDDSGANVAFVAVAFAGSVLLAVICRSWHNLLVNYGRLNAAKFRVLSKIESLLGIRAFDAEWVALGKGLRKSKYQSFTATEAIVPKALMRFFFCLSFIIAMIALPFVVETVGGAGAAIWEFLSLEPDLPQKNAGPQ